MTSSRVISEDMSTAIGMNVVVDWAEAYDSHETIWSVEKLVFPI
jgi:hypothetical protein